MPTGGRAACSCAVPFVLLFSFVFSYLLSLSSRVLFSAPKHDNIHKPEQREGENKMIQRGTFRNKSKAAGRHANLDQVVVLLAEHALPEVVIFIV